MSNVKVAFKNHAIEAVVQLLHKLEWKQFFEQFVVNLALKKT